MPINDLVLAATFTEFKRRVVAAHPPVAQLVEESDPPAPAPVADELTKQLNRALRLYSRRWREALNLGEECPPGWKFCPDDGACIPENQSCSGEMSFAEALGYMEAAAGQYFDLAITASQRDATRELFLETIEPLLARLPPAPEPGPEVAPVA